MGTGPYVDGARWFPAPLKEVAGSKGSIGNRPVVWGREKVVIA
jgi:hypothetical protein